MICKNKATHEENNIMTDEIQMKEFDGSDLEYCTRVCHCFIQEQSKEFIALETGSNKEEL